MYKGTANTKQEQYLSQIEQDLEDFIYFYEVIDAKITQEKVEMRKYVDKEVDEDGFIYHVGPAAEEISKINSTLFLLYNSVFIALYSFFELRLISTVNIFANQQKVKITLSDLKADNEIEKIQKYLTKVFGLDLIEMDQMFYELQEYRKIRNALVHNGGYLSKEKGGKQLIDKIKQNVSLHFAVGYLNADSGYVSIKNSLYIKDFCAFIPKFFGQILHKLYPTEVN